MFQAFEWNGTNIGFSTTADNIFIFFGNRKLTYEELPQVFPQFTFFKLKQIHSSEIIEAARGSPVADAHFTRNVNEALVIQTADCMPIMFAAKHAVAACHAGWRGLAASIIPLTMSTVDKVDFVYVGPHIGRESFEVGADVAEEIINSAGVSKPNEPFIYPHKDSTKRFIDLAAVAKSQICGIQIPPPGIVNLELDTKTNLGFHSFRRDGTRAERQYSFIVRLQ